MIAFEKAYVAGVKHKIKAGQVLSVIEFVTTFDPKTAHQLGNKWLVFDSEGFAREGMKSLEMDYELQNRRIKLTPRGLEKFELDLSCDLLNKFKVFKSGSKKKKVSVRLKFMASCTASPYLMLDYLMKAGGADGRLEIHEIEQPQEDLFDPKAAKAAAKKKEAEAPKQSVIPVAEGPKALPVAGEGGIFPVDGAERLNYSTDKCAAILYVLEVDGGWAYGHSVAFTNGVGEEFVKPSLLNYTASEAYARRMAAEGAYKFTQVLYAKQTPQVRREIEAMQEWLRPYIDAVHAPQFGELVHA